MIKEEALFIQILADHLNGRRTEICDSQIDWNTIVSCAKKHQVSGIVYTQIKDYLPQDKLADLHQEMRYILFFQSNREDELGIIRNVFNETHIPFFIIKGPSLASLYPVPILRTMVDTDIVVHTENRERCHELLRNHGFECITKQQDREWQYYKRNMEYELHDHLVYSEAVNKEGQAEFFNDCWTYVNNNELDWSFHLLFLLFHLGKHLMNAGVGFRQFMDLAVVAQKKQLDWGWIEKKLTDLNMIVFAQKCFGLIERWFGIKTPITAEVDDAFFGTATEQIIGHGIFGHNDKDKTITNEVRHNAVPHLRMAFLLLKKAFPPICELRKAPQYAYLKKASALLPCAWIHRWLRGFRHRKLQSLIRLISDSFTSNEAIRKRNNILEQWGL